MGSPGEDGKLSFERDIRPLVRAKDRDSMLAAFDLFDYVDVVENANAVVGFRHAAGVKLGRAIARNLVFAPFVAPPPPPTSPSSCWPNASTCASTKADLL